MGPRCRNLNGTRPDAARCKQGVAPAPCCAGGAHGGGQPSSHQPGHSPHGTVSISRSTTSPRLLVRYHTQGRGSPVSLLVAALHSSSVSISDHFARHVTACPLAAEESPSSKEAAAMALGLLLFVITLLALAAVACWKRCAQCLLWQLPAARRQLPTRRLPPLAPCPCSAPLIAQSCCPCTRPAMQAAGPGRQPLRAWPQVPPHRRPLLLCGASRRQPPTAHCAPAAALRLSLKRHTIVARGCVPAARHASS